MTVYVAPMDGDGSEGSDGEAGRHDRSGPCGSTVAMRDMVYMTDGKQNLIDVMSTYKNPFNVIVGTLEMSPIAIKAGDPVPTGKLDAVVQITAHAGL